MLRDSVVVAVVRTRPRAIPLAKITMRKSAHGLPFVSHLWDAYGAPLGGPSGRRSSAITVISSWEVNRLPNTKAIHFSRHGIPDFVISDSGPQFTSDGRLRKYVAFGHLISSPGTSDAGGKATSGVKTAKRILKKSIKAATDSYLAVLGYRNTHTQGVVTRLHNV